MKTHWWQRVVDRWGVDAAIRLAQRHAERAPDYPGRIYDYTEWRREHDGSPPWGQTFPTMTYEVFWW